MLWVMLYVAWRVCWVRGGSSVSTNILRSPLESSLEMKRALNEVNYIILWMRRVERSATTLPASSYRISKLKVGENCEVHQ